MPSAGAGPLRVTVAVVVPPTRSERARAQSGRHRWRCRHGEGGRAADACERGGEGRFIGLNLRIAPHETP